jgi:hypothetical protein
MLVSLNRLFRQSRFWFNGAPVKKNRLRPQLESLDERVVPAGGTPPNAYYWTGAASTNDGSDVNNWSTSATAQTAPASAPGATADLYFSNNYGATGNNSNVSCQLKVGNYHSINSTTAYTMTVSDTQTAVAFSSGSSFLGGKIDTGTGTWTFTSVAATPNSFGTATTTVTFIGGGTIATTGMGNSSLVSVATADNLNLGDVTDTFTSITFSAGATGVATTVNASTALVGSATGATYTGLNSGTTWYNPITLVGPAGTSLGGVLDVVANTTINTFVNDNGGILVTGANTLTMGGQTGGWAITGSGSVAMDSISAINLGTVSGTANWMVLIAPSTASILQTGLFITRDSGSSGQKTATIIGNVLIQGTSTAPALLTFNSTTGLDSLWVTGALDMQQYSTILMRIVFGPPDAANGITCGSLTISATLTTFQVNFAGTVPASFNYLMINDTGTLTGDFKQYNPPGYNQPWAAGQLYLKK